MAVLARSLAPELDPGVYTFATIPDIDSEIVKRAVGIFREPEGVSVICLRGEAVALGLRHEGAFRKISLTVHSSLQAVGLTALLSTVLAKNGISCNVVAGFYHDHLFVPVDRADEALALLSDLR